MERNLPRLPVFVLFFLSGACGLIYEIVWTRLLTLVMGNTIYSITTVLTVFMGGLALGSFLAGRFITGRKGELRIYGLLEGIIGCYCILIPHFIDLVTPFYREIYLSLQNSYFLFSLIRFAVSFMILLIPTTLMGATLPVLTKYFAQRKETIGGTIGKVYAINTFGAVLGSFGAGFILLPLLGTGLVILVTGLTNLSICGLALLLSKRHTVPAPDEVKSYPETIEPGEPPSGTMRLLLWSFALSGFAAMVYQVIWTRMLTLMIGSSTYAFSLIVTAFILGIGIGSIVLSGFIDRRRDLIFLFALAELLIGTSAMLIAYAFGRLPFTVVTLIGRFKSSFAMTQLIEFLLVFALLLVPTTMMGAIFPLVSRISTRSLSTVGRAVGSAYAANTLGAILGSFVGGFIFIPFLGMEKGIVIALSLNFLIGSVLLLISPRGRMVRRTALLVLWVGVSAVFEWWSPPWNRDWITMGPYVYFSEFQGHGTQMSPEIRDEVARYVRLIYFEEGVSATISVRKNSRGQLSLQVNGKTDASSGEDMATQVLLAQIPMMLHPEPSDVLVIGLASGVTVGSVETYPARSITCVEISPEMVKASDFFRQYNHNALDDPRFTLRIEDGRNHLLLTDETYDVIISEPTNPWISGVGNLFTLEYFRLLEEKLRDGGMACVWLQAYGLTKEDFKMIVRTFNEVFPSVSLWEPSIGNDYLMIGQKGPFTLDWESLKTKYDIPAAGADLERIGVESPEEILQFMIMGPSRVREFEGRGLLHTDDNSRLEFSSPKYMYTNTIIPQLEAIGPYRENPMDYLEAGTLSDEEREKITSIVDARRMTVDGILTMNKGDIVGGENLLKMALSYFPGEDEARSRLSRGNENEIIRLTELGDWEELETVSRATLSLDENNLPAMDGLSTALLNRKSYDQAIRILEKAALRYPDYPAFHAKLGYAYARKGRTDEAVASYEAAAAKDPQNAHYAFDLGVLYLSAKRYPDAVACFRNAVRNDPTFVDAFINLGGTLARLGMRDDAKRSFQEALRIDPHNEIARKNLSLLK